MSEYLFTLNYSEFEKEVRSIVKVQAQKNLERPEKISISALSYTNQRTVGRNAEIEQLNRAWASNDISCVEITAFGGVGKTTLISTWLLSLDRGNYGDAEVVYAWSFQGNGSQEVDFSAGDFFIENALEWFEDPDPAKGSSWSKAIRLASIIKKQRSLIILDGLEAIQNTTGANIGRIGNPGIRFLIKELAFENSGLVVLSSRIQVTDINAYRNNKILTLNLRNLSLEGSIKLLKGAGVSGNRLAFRKAFKEYEGHALSLLVLAGYLSVATDRKLEIDSSWDSIITSNEPSERASNIIEAYIDWLENKAQLLALQLISILDCPTPISQILELINKSRIIKHIDVSSSIGLMDLRSTLVLLEKLQLISIYPRQGESIVGCHPLVRDCIKSNTQSKFSKRWIDLQSEYFEFLKEKADYATNKRSRIEFLHRAIRHGIAARQLNKAFEVYYALIKQKQFSLPTEMSHIADNNCLKLFFDKEWDRPICSLSEEAKAYLVSCASANLIYLGSIDEALAPADLGYREYTARGKWVEAAVIAAPVVSMLIASGKISRAEEFIVEATDVVEKAANPILEASCAVFEGYIYHLQGDKKQAEIEFEMAECQLTKGMPINEVTFPTISSYYCKFLLDTGRTKNALLRSLKTFKWRESNSWQTKFDITSLYASDLLVLGLIYLELEEFEKSKELLDRQVKVLRDAGEWLYLPIGLHSRSLYFLKLGELARAEKDLSESLELSLHTGATFSEWECYLNYALLYAKKNDIEQSSEYLAKAENLEGMSLYKFRDKEIAELKKQLASASSILY